MRPYLIQRASFKDVRLCDVTGPDSLLHYDYMGSSEFEFGGLNKSLRRVVATLDDYASWVTDILAKDGRALVLLCKVGDRKELVGMLPLIRDWNLRTKEPARLDDALACKEFARTNFWWDIENDWMMWLDEVNTPLVKKALEKMRERWGG